MTFGEKLQALRKKSGLSQEQLAEKLEVSRQTISKWELNETLPDTAKVVQLSRLFEVTTDLLLLDEQEILPPEPAPQAENPVRRRISLYAVVSGILTAIGALGILLFEFLSSVFPVKTAETQRGQISLLRSYLAHYHLTWLFTLCEALIILAILILLFPRIKKWFRKIYRS